MSADDRSPASGRADKAPPSFLERLRHVFAPEPPPRAAGENGEDGPHHASDLVDQAEAFQTLRVSDVMTPRADIVALELSTPFEEVVRQFAESEHSRMPVYRETLDEPVGVVHIKDVFKLLQPHGAMAPPALDERVLRRLRREVLYVPASMRAADLLLRMQARRIHMALVIDEFGGTDGLVTMEDLIEAVVGDIDDEHDVAGPGVISGAGGVFEAEARAALEDLEAALGEPLTPEDIDEEIDTVGGLVVTVAGRVPQRGEVIVHPKGYDLEVLDADPRRVKRVRIRRTEPPAADTGRPTGSVAST
ncbi:MAG TPA: hemolysin family protein [Caulobacteraceae bacterium]|jgi:CBS domain containing-hemolysin-like protein